MKGEALHIFIRVQGVTKRKKGEGRKGGRKRRNERRKETWKE